MINMNVKEAIEQEQDFAERSLEYASIDVRNHDYEAANRAIAAALRRIESVKVLRYQEEKKKGAT